ncbi:hypothetical protein [Cellulomonas telluris]|uniref:hypothetical protein n=1 Tax=Cellulomonas telluris TaxID=2306636 RepID=UPI0010A7AB61|nr:hypothetical protein [Cellulomonas telluris]
MTDPHGADAPDPVPDTVPDTATDEPQPAGSAPDTDRPPSRAPAAPAHPRGGPGAGPLPWAASGPDDDLADAATPGVAVPDAAAALDLMLRLVGPERAGPPALWFALLDAERRLLPVVLPLSEVPLRPDPAAARQVVHVLASVLEREAPGGSAVVAVVRAAGGDQGSFERAWAHALVLAATDRDLTVSAVVAIGEHRARVLAV